MSDTPNISIGSVTGGQNNIGKTDIAGDQNQTNNYGGTSITFEQFIQAIKEQLPVEQLEQVQSEVLDPLCDIAAEPEPDSEQDRVTLKARIMAIVEKLEPYTPYIRKTIAAFAEGALLAVPGAGLAWGAKCIIAGCIEVVRDARAE